MLSMLGVAGMTLRIYSVVGTVFGVLSVYERQSTLWIVGLHCGWTSGSIWLFPEIGGVLCQSTYFGVL